MLSPGSVSTYATVPGGIFTDLLAAGLIDEPYYAFNDQETKWVTREEWTYKRTFTGECRRLEEHHYINPCSLCLRWLNVEAFDCCAILHESFIHWLI